MRNEDDKSGNTNRHPRSRTGKTARERARRFNRAPVAPATEKKG